MFVTFVDKWHDDIPSMIVAWIVNTVVCSGYKMGPILALQI